MRFMRRLKNDFVFLTIGTVIGSIITFFYSVYSKKLTNPKEYGIFTATSIILTYLNYFQLGTMNAYNRDYPQLVGAGKPGEAKSIKDATLSYLLVVYGAVIAVSELAILIICAEKGVSPTITYAYMIIVFESIFVILNSFALTSAKLEGKFNFAALVYILQTLMSVGAGLLLISRFGYLGLYAQSFLSAMVGIVLCYKYCFKDFHFNWNHRIIKDLLLSGIPLLVNNLIWTVVGSIDKFVILVFMDTTRLGYYSIATMAFSTMVLIPQTMSNVFYIKINKEYGKNRDKNTLVEASQKYTWLSSVCTGLICLVGYYFLPIFIERVMPNYDNGISAAQITILGIAIYSSTMLFGNIFTILRENKALMLNSISLCVISLTLSVLFVLVLGDRIEMVALGTSISYLLYSVMLVAKLKKITELSIFSFFYYSWLPVICAMIPCLIADLFPISIVAKLGLSLVLCVATIVFLFKKVILAELRRE